MWRVADLLELARVTATLPLDDPDVLRELERMDRGEIGVREALALLARVRDMRWANFDISP